MKNYFWRRIYYAIALLFFAAIFLALFFGPHPLPWGLALALGVATIAAQYAAFVEVRKNFR